MDPFLAFHGVTPDSCGVQARIILSPRTPWVCSQVHLPGHPCVPASLCHRAYDTVSHTLLKGFCVRWVSDLCRQFSPWCLRQREACGSVQPRRKGHGFFTCCRKCCCPVPGLESGFLSVTPTFMSSLAFKIYVGKPRTLQQWWPL